MPLPSRFGRDVQRVVDVQMDLDPTSIGLRIDQVEEELAGKANVNHSHSIAQITDLQATLNDKASASSVSALAGRVSNTETAVNSLTGRVSSVEGSTNSLADRVSENEADINSLVTELGDLSAIVTDKASIVAGAVQLPVCTSTNLPAVSPAGRLVYVSDLTAIAVSTGVDWLNTQTGAAI